MRQARVEAPATTRFRRSLGKSRGSHSQSRDFGPQKKKRFCAAILSSRPPFAFADSRGKHAQGRLFAVAVRDVGAAHATETDRRFGGERGVDGRALEAEAARDDNLPRAAAPTPTSHWPGP